jgi:hypothetical protein
MEEGGGGKKSLEWRLGLNIGVEGHNADVLKEQGESKSTEANACATKERFLRRVKCDNEQTALTAP